MGLDLSFLVGLRQVTHCLLCMETKWLQLVECNKEEQDGLQRLLESSSHTILQATIRTNNDVCHEQEPWSQL